jgi:hypothetical protein
MRPNTSVRQPVIAGARRHQLADLLRSWRSQPRKRSPALFWSLIAVAFVLDGALAFLAVQLLGLAGQEAADTAERRMYVPHAANAALWEPMRRWAIRMNGRPQLFESVCREAVRRITGAERFEDNDPLAVTVSWMLNGSAWEEYPFLRCEQAELRALLYREGGGMSHLSREEQLHGWHIEPAVVHQSKSFRKILRGIAAKGSVEEGIQLSALESEAVELNQRLVLFDHLRTNGVDGGDSAEMKTAAGAWGEAYRSGDPDLFATALTDFLDASRRALRLEADPKMARRLALEIWLNEYRPFRQAMYWSLLATGLLAISTIAGARRPLGRRGCLLSGLLARIGCLGWSAAGFVCQTILHDGVLVCDGADGVIWGCCVAMALGLFLALLYRDGFLALAGALVAGGGFVLANRWPPALPANWLALPIAAGGDAWLNLQAFLVIGGYAALMFAWGLAALALARLILVPPPAERLRALASRCARALGITVALLAASAVLEGFRAMQSSGTWHTGSMQALGTLLILPCCAALLYAHRAGWIPAFGLVTSAVLAFTLILTGWYTSLLLGTRDGRLSNFDTLAPMLAASLINLSLTAHATLRYYFSKQTA